MSGEKKKDSLRNLNNLSSFSLFVDSHIQEIRYGVCGIGVIGGLLILRSVHMTKIFQHVDEIPDRFFAKAIRLQGRVHTVDKQGILHVEHIPVINLRGLSRNTAPRPLLPVTLACVDILPDSQLWLEDKLVNRNVWFRLLCKSSVPDNNCIECMVYMSKLLRNTCINEELVRRGLCSVTDYSRSPLPKHPRQIKLVEKLYRLQSKADKKSLGIWKNAQCKESGLTSQTFTLIKWIVKSPFLLFQKIWQLKRR